MKYSKRVGVILFAVLVAVSLINEYYITPLAISDSDFTTYMIVPLLMLPLFAIFTAKERIVPKVGKRDIVVGLLAFAALLVLILAMRIWLSYIFVDMRIDMLLFPLMIGSLAILLFGVSNIGKFKAIMVYSLFASPALLIWLNAANGSFVSANTIMVYSVLKLFLAHVSYIAPITISANGYSVGIGQTCVGIGILIGIVMFLAPLAYLYDGKGTRKVLWVASGFALMLVLNLLRMLSIATAWFVYGPSNTILTIHLFAGIILFYISIIVMILLSGKYGLSMPMPAKKKVKTRLRQLYAYGIVAAIAITLIYFAMLSDYTSLHPVSPLSVYQSMPFNATKVTGIVHTISNQSRFNVTAVQDYVSNYVIIRLTNATYNSTLPIAMLISSSKINYISSLTKNNTVVGTMTFLSNSSTVQRMYYIYSEGHDFIVYYSVVPYFYSNGTSTSAGIYAVLPANVTSQSITCSDYYNTLYTDAANIQNLGSRGSVQDAKMMSAYCIVEGLVSR